MQTDVIRRISIEATQKGVAETTAGLKGLADAQSGIVSSSERSEKSSISVAAAYERQQRSLDLTYRATQQFEKAQKTLDQAQQQGLVTSARHAELSALNTARFAQLSNASNVVEKDIGKVGQIMGVVESRALGLNASMGMVGTVLQIIGPVGIAVGASLGAAAAALAVMSSAAHALAEKAKEIRELSEATGLSTTQFQALRSEAGKFGIDSETLGAGLSKFTAGFEALRLGNGELLTGIRKINLALAEEMQQTTDAATAFTLFGQAVQQTDNIFQRNALLKAGLGRGAAIFGGLFESAPNVAALGTAFAAAGKGIDEGLVKRLATLQVEIDKTTNAAKTTFASIFAETTLRDEKTYAEGLLTIATRLKEISNSSAPSWLSQAIRVAQTGSFDPATQARTSLRQGLGYGAESSSSAQAISDAVPRTRSYSQIVSDTFIGPAAGAAKTPEALANDLKNLVAVLGSAASPAQKLGAAIAELGIKSKEAGLGEDVLAKGVAALKFDDAVARQNAHNAALGQSASVTDIVAAKTLELAKAQQQGAGLTATQIANQIKLTETQALGTFQIDAQTAAEKTRNDTLLMSSPAAIAYTMVQTKINEAIALGKPLTEAQVANLQKSADAFAKTKVQADLYADTLATVKDAYTEVGKAIFSAALQGKLGMDSLVSTLDNVAKKLSDKAFENLLTGALSGDPAQMAIGAAQAGVSALISAFTGDQKAKKALEEAQTRWHDMAGQVSAFNLAAKGVNLGPLTQELQSLFSSVETLLKAAQAAKDRSGENQAAAMFNSSVERIFKQFSEGNQVLTPLQQQLKAVNDEAAGLKETLLQIGPGFSGFAAGVDGVLQRQIADVVAKFHDTFISGLTTRLNSAKGQGFLNDTANLLLQHAQDLASVKDLGNDPTLLSQVSTTFHAEAQKIVDDAQLVGTAFSDFTTQFPMLKDVVHEFTQSAVDDSKALRDAQNSAAKSITDYLNGLVAGPSSTQSPIATLASAQTLYGSNLALAQGGNVDAQNKFVSLADNLEKAARAVYASGTGYQDIRNQIINQGLNLPAVQATTDPVTQAVRDSITAIQAGNAVLATINATAGGTTTAVGNANTAITSGLTGASGLLPAVNAGNATAVAASLKTYLEAISSAAGGTTSALNDNIKPAVDAGNATAVKSALTALFNQIDPSGNLASIIGTTDATRREVLSTNANFLPPVKTAVDAAKGSVDSGNSTLAAIQGLQTTATTQLGLIKEALDTSGVSVVTVSHNTPGSPSTTTDTAINNQLVQALNKIVYNTALIVHNTWAIAAGGATNTSGSAADKGLFASGGWITGGIPGRDSVPIVAMPNEFMVNANATRSLTQQFGSGVMDVINSGRLPFNDNGRPLNVVAPAFRGGGDNGNAALLARIDKLTAEVENLQKIVAGSGANIARTVESNGDKIKGSVDDQTKARNAQERQSNLQRKVANG